MERSDGNLISALLMVLMAKEFEQVPYSWIGYFIALGYGGLCFINMYMEYHKED